MDIANNRALLLSEDIIDKKPYDDVSYEEWKKASYRITWAECSLQKYLNGTFYESFGKDKERIEPTPNENPDNPEYGTKGGSRSTDKVFLLSIDEARRYFRNDNERKAKFNGSGFWWWLRSPGFTQYGAAFVDGDGNVCLGGNPVNFDAGGVRPALWLDL
ncbi:MAG: DUF6273 domain-containing protein [Oscillospiraceae bacterium]|nr:DUF6273 domain-containing protein [Oscillospiraceae bacterium]